MIPPRFPRFARFPTALAAFAIWIALTPHAGSAGGLVPETMTCPVDDTAVEAVRPVSTNALGGIDSDFCQYAKGGQPREHGVATCPTCHYSALVDGFERPLGDGQRAALLEMLGNATQGLAGEGELNPWDRYQLAALCAGVLDESALHRGDLLLTAAWTVRDRVVGFLPGIDGPLDARMRLDDLDGQWIAIPDLLTQQRGLFLLVQLAHRGGFSDRRDAYLGRLDELQPVPPEVAALRTEIQSLIPIEDRFLGKAVQHFEAGLAEDDTTPEAKLRYRYLVVDLKRRLGETAGLREELNVLITDPYVTEGTRVAAKSLKEVLP